LDVRLRDYKRLGPEWGGRFDAVIANGSLEHFAQPADAVAGRDDDIYRYLFAIVHRLLDPGTPGGRFVTTAIHFRNRPDPRDLTRPPSAFPGGRRRSTGRGWRTRSAAGTRCAGNWRRARRGTSG
jgi:cyclopropane fatty-acyl-phospholipid synthase-like methyltransferase